MKNIHPDIMKKFDEKFVDISDDRTLWKWKKSTSVGQVRHFILTHFIDKKIVEEEIEKYPHICGACSEKVSNLSHTLACQMKKHLKQSLLNK